MKKKEKNIFWQKHKDLQKKNGYKDFLAKLKSNNLKASTFYKHCSMSIEDIPFKYIKLYGCLFGITLNELENGG